MNSGFFFIDKPVGISSFDIIRKLRKITNIKKMGHAGTLDPFASGLVIVCVGKVTRTVSFLSCETKSYDATVILGKKTSTGDPEGEIIERKDKLLFNIDEDKLSDDVKSIKSQIPPRYSAIKVDGKRAYELARKNQEFTLKERDINIYDFCVLSKTDKSLSYRVKVSKGTYIRVLSEQIANLLGTIGYTCELRRISVGNLSVSKAVSLNEITVENWKKYFFPLEKYPFDFPTITLSDNLKEKYKNGMFFPINEENGFFLILDLEKKGLGFASVSNKLLKPKLVMI